jgi:hypothetical protein
VSAFIEGNYHESGRLIKPKLDRIIAVVEAADADHFADFYLLGRARHRENSILSAPTIS